MQKNILIVDDSSLIRSDLRKIIDTVPNLEIAGEASDADTAVRLVNELKPEIILLDIALENGTGIEILKRIKINSYQRTIIMFTNNSHDALREKSITLGADYFFDKSKDIENLIRTLKNL